MNKQLLEQGLALSRAGRAYVLATVVRCEKPTSAKPGDSAIITEDGRLIGWVGGSCARPIVVREALKALKEKQPRLIRIGAEEAARFGAQEGVSHFEMTCFSGGTMEIFVEPVLPSEQLVLVGASPDMVALAQMASVMNFQVTVMDPDPESELPENVVYRETVDFDWLQDAQRSYIVIGTHGRFDEEALEQAARTESPYIGLIASPKRAASVIDFVRRRGVPEEQVRRIKAPAGLDIGAQTPEEIALSILTEIVQFRRSQRPAEHVEEAPAVQEQEPRRTAIDPICNMEVEIATARYKTEFQGTTYYFCCAGCLHTFEQNPEQWVAVQA